MWHHIGMPNHESPNWGHLLAQMCETGMTQAEVGEAVGLSQASVSEMLRGFIKTTDYKRGVRIIAAHKAVMRKAKRATEGAPAVPVAQEG